MATGRRNTILTGVLAAFAAVLFVAPAAARMPAFKSAPTQHRSALTAEIATNSVYARGCANGTIPDAKSGGDNNNYEYYGNPCGF